MSKPPKMVLEGAKLGWYGRAVLSTDKYDVDLS